MAQYADIVLIDAPAEAIAGTSVPVVVRIKNLYSSVIGIMVGGALEYGVVPWPSIDFPANTANVNPGQTYYFAGRFVMPNSAVKIHAYSYFYGADDLWHLDDEEIKEVKLGVLTPQFRSFTFSEYVKA